MHQASILVVCTGNICRSPLAAGLFQHLQAECTVSSAGTHAWEPLSPPAEILRQAQAWGFSLNQHRAQELTAEAIRSADLILTAERMHRAATVELEPSAIRKTFSIRQFARVSSAWATAVENGTETSPELDSLSALVSEIADYRALVLPPAHPSADDIADPYQRPQSSYDLSAEQIHDAITAVSTILDTHLHGRS